MESTRTCSAPCVTGCSRFLMTRRHFGAMVLDDSEALRSYFPPDGPIATTTSPRCHRVIKNREHPVTHGAELACLVSTVFLNSKKQARTVLLKTGLCAAQKPPYFLCYSSCFVIHCLVSDSRVLHRSIRLEILLMTQLDNLG